MQFYKECYLYSEIIHFRKLGDPVYLPSHTSILARESKVAEIMRIKRAEEQVEGISTNADVTLQSTRRKKTKL